MSFYTAIDLNILRINQIKAKTKLEVRRNYEAKHLPYSQIRKIVTPKREAEELIKKLNE